MNINDKSLVRLTKTKKKKRKNTTTSGIEEEVITIDLMESKRKIKKNYKQLDKHKFDNCDVITYYLIMQSTKTYSGK